MLTAPRSQLRIRRPVQLGSNRKQLPPRSTAGQLTLDQHIGVRIPGGQPKTIQYLRWFPRSDARTARFRNGLWELACLSFGVRKGWSQRLAHNVDELSGRQ
jgi:hypothetical protein